MKDFKEILLEKLKVSGNTINYDYDTVYWDREILERVLTFIISNDEITGSFFDNNPEQKIPELFLSFYPEDEEGNYVKYNGIYEHRKGNNLRYILFDDEDIEEVFGPIDYSDKINIYYYFNGLDPKTIIFELKADDTWFYNIFGDKEINKVINLFPKNLVEAEDDRRSLLQAYELYADENR